MNAHTSITAAPHFTLAQAEAIATDAHSRADEAYAKRSPWEPWQHTRWEALKEIEYCAYAVLDDLYDGAGFVPEAHAALSAAMEAFGCDSIWAPLRSVAA